jgi:hypothetical protein
MPRTLRTFNAPQLLLSSLLLWLVAAPAWAALTFTGDAERDFVGTGVVTVVDGACLKKKKKKKKEKIYLFIYFFYFKRWWCGCWLASGLSVSSVGMGHERPSLRIRSSN